MKKPALTPAVVKALKLFVAEGVEFRNFMWTAKASGQEVRYATAKQLSQLGLIAYSGTKENGGAVEHWHVTDAGREAAAKF